MGETEGKDRSHPFHPAHKDPEQHRVAAEEEVVRAASNFSVGDEEAEGEKPEDAGGGGEGGAQPDGEAEEERVEGGLRRLEGAPARDRHLRQGFQAADP